MIVKMALFLAVMSLMMTTTSLAATFNAPSSIPTCLRMPSMNATADPSATPTCFDNPNSPVRYFTLVLSHITIPGYSKPVIAVNGTYPGPTLEINQYDIVKVLLINNLDNETSLHFHGARQYKSPHMDGVLGLTQCPVPINGSAVYTFCADRSGSYWYHGHAGQQYSDGLYGTYLVYPAGGDAYASQYTHDIPVMIADYYNKPTDSYIPWYLSPASGGGEPVPDYFNINGHFTRQLSYPLPANAKVRFRFISAASLSFFNVSIDGYTMTVIEVDGVDTQPYEVNSIYLNVAQRVSVLVDLSKGNSWAANRNGVYIRAVSTTDMYDKDQIPASIDLSPVATIYLCKSNTQANCGNMLSMGGLIQIPSIVSYYSNNLNAKAPDAALDYNDAVYAQAPNTITDLNMLGLKPLYPGYATSNNAACWNPFYSDVQKPEYLLPLVFAFENDPFNINRGMFNGISYDMMRQYQHLYQQPLSNPMPLLYDMVTQGSPYYRRVLNNTEQNWISTPANDLSASIAQLFNFTDATISAADISYVANTYNSTAPSSSDNWNMVIGNAMGQYILPANETVELFIVNTDVGFHPIHLHGYSFWIIASSEMPDIQPPYLLRDVLTLPPSGWIKIRIQTDNPGVWVIHCHISWHFDAGLAAVLIDNLPALQNDPAYSYYNMIPADHDNNCAMYDPIEAPPPIKGGCVAAAFVDNDAFVQRVTVAESAKWVFTSDLVIMSEAFIGLIMYKLKILDFMLMELICINIGTLVGAVFIEFIMELYEKVFEDKVLTYVNVATIMCMGFIFPFMVEKFFKRGRSGKFRFLTNKRQQDQEAAAAAAAAAAAEAKQKALNDDNTAANNAGVGTLTVKATTSTNDSNNNNNGGVDYVALGSPTGASTPNNLERQTSAQSLLPLVVESDEQTGNVVFHIADLNTPKNAPQEPQHEKKKSKSVNQVVDAAAPAVVGTGSSVGTGTDSTTTKSTPDSSELRGEGIASVRTERPTVTEEVPPEAVSLIQRQGSESTMTHTPLQTLSAAPTQPVANIEMEKVKTIKADAPPQQQAANHRRGSSSVEKLANLLAKPQADWNLIFIVLAGEAVDTFVDGGIIAAAYLAGSATGLASSLGVFMEELTHMTGSFAVFVAAGASLWKCVLINCISALFLMLGSAFILAISTAPGVDINSINYLLAFAAGTYLYVAMVDLTALITSQPWSGWWRAITSVLAISFGIGIQAAIAVYHWRSGTS